MRDVPASAPVAGRRGQFGEALRHIEKVLTDGLSHGFFDCSIVCEITNGGKRQLVIRAGKSHKFHIPEDELPR
ncbi:MAG: hypothetical protein FJX46_01095 [Alphaproteobacteria bacterium]|nr:hypothetical protein [Alphaproteobacteria bacterium]